MLFYSTNNRNHQVDLKTAVVKGLAPDQGLYMPEKIPVLPEVFFQSMRGMDFKEIGYEVIKSLFEKELGKEDIRELVDHTLTFDAPLVEVENGVYSLELFHGPTLAFKDFGARFCSKLMALLMKEEPRKVRVLVATSGDTGSAVANGFFQVPGVEVIVLYPKGKVSELQEKQFTTLGGNVTALEVDGVFDDCQAMVKAAFIDPELNERMLLTSANSINIARWIPQSLYYFRAFSQLPEDGKKTVFSVPSGNFGNIGAGILAAKMGLPIDHFVAATNINKVVPEYLAGESFSPRPSLATISNSMDVGNPSNFYRLLDLYEGDEQEFRKKVYGFYADDSVTRETMVEVKKRTGYVLDPHGAVGYLGLKEFLARQTEAYKGIFLETAHPAKFKSVVDETLGIDLPIPERLQQFMAGEKQVMQMSNDFAEFKDFLKGLEG